MKIAVTNENGQVFQHFGRTESFRVYDVEDKKVLSVETLNSNGVGHEALAELLAEYKIDVLICGGMGAGAAQALKAAGIEVVSGAAGYADEVVQLYLRGELETEGVNCDHHDGEMQEEFDDCECGCECGEDCDCEGGCGGCGGGCHRMPPVEGPNVGKTVKVHYCGTFNDGTQFDSSYDRNEPLEFVCGAGMMIHGFDQAVATMTLGEVKNVHLMPEDAYGEADPQAIISIEIAKLPGSENLEVGQRVALQNQYGQPVPVTVIGKDDIVITFDANHEMAGKELNFKIELVEIA